MGKKNDPKGIPAQEALERAEAERAAQQYVLRLYVAGITPRSEQAIRNVKALCEKHLAGRYDLEVVDIYQRPQLAKGEQIIAAPTLIKKPPLPLRKLTGSMNEEEKVLVGLDIKRKEATDGAK